MYIYSYIYIHILPTSLRTASAESSDETAASHRISPILFDATCNNLRLLRQVAALKYKVQLSLVEQQSHFLANGVFIELDRRRG